MKHKKMLLIKKTLVLAFFIGCTITFTQAQPIIFSRYDTLPDYPFLYKYGWDSGDTLDGELPEVFLIFEPECQAIENITVTADPNGCLHAVWDSLPWQGHEVTACSLGGGQAVLDVSALPRGVYLLRLASDKGAASRRVVLL